jgi:ribokinase
VTPARARPTERATIAVVGSLNLDLVVRVARLPDEGETLLAHGYVEHAGGKGANQALAAARLGGRIAMVGRVGRDEAGRRLRDGLGGEGVDVSHVRAVDAPSGRALIEVADDGRNRIVVVPGANHAWSEEDLPEEPLATADVLVAQLEVPPALVAAAVRRAAAAGARVVLNAAPAAPLPAGTLAATAVLVANQGEAGQLLGVDGRAVAADAEDAAARLTALGAGAAVVTLGAAGAAFAEAATAATSGDGGRIHGTPLRAVDTTGAGDAFVGALAVRLAEGASLREAARFACAAGAEAVTREGAQPSLPRRAAVLRRLGATA